MLKRHLAWVQFTWTLIFAACVVDVSWSDSSDPEKGDFICSIFGSCGLTRTIQPKLSTSYSASLIQQWASS